MNNTNEEVNDMGQSVIAVFPYIYFMSDTLRPAQDGDKLCLSFLGCQVILQDIYMYNYSDGVCFYL